MRGCPRALSLRAAHTMYHGHDPPLQHDFYHYGGGEEGDNDGIILSTAQLDCRLLPGELIVAHIARELHLPGGEMAANVGRSEKLITLSAFTVTRQVNMSFRPHGLF